MASSKKSSTEKKSKVKEAGISKPPSKTKINSKSSKKSEKGDSKTNKKKNTDKKHVNNGTAKNTDVLVLSVSGSESREDDAREERDETTSKKANSSKSKKVKRNHGKKDETAYEEAEEKIYNFPMHRVKKIMKNENSDLWINQEALFIVNKATEMFLVQFCKDSFACCAQDRKKSLAYKHLASVVGKRKRYDFLSDFVPEKSKLEDALRERNMAETGKG